MFALGAGALWGAPTADADFDDLLTTLLDPGDWGAVIDPGNWDGFNFDPSGDEIAQALAAADTTNVADTPLAPGEVPLTVQGDGAGYPAVDISIGGQDPVSVLVDTGTHGLVIPIWDLPLSDILDELKNFSLEDIIVLPFPGSITVGLAVPTSVDFGNGIVAEDTVANATLFSFPFSPTIGQPVEGILGIGPNAGGVGDTQNVTADLPGDFGKGVLLDEPGGRLVFGSQPDSLDGYSVGATLDGAPFPGGSPYFGGVTDTFPVQIGSGPAQDMPVVFDSGGLGGWIPAENYGDGTSMFGSVPAGTSISVLGPDGAPLYSATTSGDGTGGTLIMPAWLLQLFGLDGYFNTGNGAFVNTPVYISNAGEGTMTFYTPTS